MDLTQADDHDINESMHAFEAAVTAERRELERASIQRILLALDGSNQDPTAAALAAMLAHRHAAQLVPVYAYAGRRDEVKDRYLARQAESLRADGHLVALPPERAADVHDEEPFAQIVGLQKRGRCDLVVACAPYLEDFTTLGTRSAGTTLDMLMAHVPVPILAVREPKEAPEACLEEVLVPVSLHPPEQLDRAGWCFDVVADGGAVRVLAVADHAMLEAAGKTLAADVDLESFDDEQLAGLRRPATAGLIAALQREASRLGLVCRVSVRAGDPVPVIAAVANDRDLIVMTGCPREPTSGAFQLVQAVARASRNPVLIV